MALQPPSTAATPSLALDDLADRWAMATDEPPPVPESETIHTVPSAFTPVLEALEVSQDVWESKFSSNNQQTARGIVHTMATSWPLTIQAEAEELVRIRQEIFPDISAKQTAVQDAWGTYASFVAPDRLLSFRPFPNNPLMSTCFPNRYILPSTHRQVPGGSTSSHANCHCAPKE